MIALGVWVSRKGGRLAWSGWCEGDVKGMLWWSKGGRTIHEFILQSIDAVHGDHRYTHRSH